MAGGPPSLMAQGAAFERAQKQAADSSMRMMWMAFLAVTVACALARVFIIDGGSPASMLASATRVIS